MYFQFISILFLIPIILSDDSLVRRTKNGFVSGRNYFIQDLNKTVNAWLGVPFAEKPIENLRFKRPVPVKSWPGVLNTTTEPFSCFQLDQEKSSEDCLYLNIWTPSTSSNLPVMIWF